MNGLLRLQCNRLICGFHATFLSLLAAFVDELYSHQVESTLKYGLLDSEHPVKIKLQSHAFKSVMSQKLSETRPKLRTSIKWSITRLGFGSIVVYNIY